MTDTYKFTGKASWAKVYDPDEFRGSSNFKINLYVDDENLDLYKKAGIQGKVKEDEEGTFVVFKRPQTKLIKNVQKIFSPPTILDKDGNVLVEYKKNKDNTGFDRIGEPVLIGNGSIVEVTVSVYPTSMGNGQRMESVRIIDLVTFEPEATGDWNDSITVGAAAETSVKKPW